MLKVASFAVIAGLAASSAALAQSSPATPTAPADGSTVGGQTAGTSTMPSTEGAGAGTSGTSSLPTAPQEKQDLRESGEAPSQHNDPGTSTSPPSPDTHK
jgi:hypothetical protein